MILLPKKATLSDLQTYVQAQCEKRNWNDRTDIEKVMMLTEEVGEIAKEVRKHTGKFGYNKPDTTDGLAGELIDALNWLIDLANSNDIDLDQAFRAKWHATASRTWER